MTLHCSGVTGCQCVLLPLPSMTPLLLLSLARLATSQISFPAFGNEIIGFIWLEMIGYILEGFDFSGLSQPQFSLNIQNDETDFHQQQQQLGPSEGFQSVQAQGNVRQQQQRLTPQQAQPQQFQPQINTQQQPQQVSQRFLQQQSQPQLQRSFQQQQQNFGSIHLEEMRQQQSRNSDSFNVRTSIQTDPNQITSHSNQPFTAFGQLSQQFDSGQQQSMQPNFQQPQIPQQPFNQQQDPFSKQQLSQQAFPQQQQTQQAFPQRFSLQQQDPRRQPQFPESQQSSFQQPIQRQQQQSLSPPSSPPSKALNVFSSPNQFPSVTRSSLGLIPQSHFSVSWRT